MALALWMSLRGLHPDSRMKEERNLMLNHVLNCRILVLVAGEDHSRFCLNNQLIVMPHNNSKEMHLRKTGCWMKIFYKIIFLTINCFKIDFIACSFSVAFVILKVGGCSALL